MSEHEERPPGRLPERLKQLDEAGPPMPEFDLDTAVRAGERRVRRRHAGTAAAAGAGLVLAGLVTGSMWTGWADDEPQPVTAPNPAELVYEQHGDSVMVYRDGDPLARVRLEAVTVGPEGSGAVEVTVDSDGPFVLSPAGFFWAGEGEDAAPTDAGPQITVEGPKQLRLSYREVSDGELAWLLPGVDQPAAVWSVGAGTSPTEVKTDRVWYLQQEDTVAVYQGRSPLAEVTVSDVGLAGETAQARVVLTATGHYELRGDDFLWAAADGTQHAMVEGSWPSFAWRGAWAIGDVGGPSAQLEFEPVREGAVVWAPGGGETVGVWAP